MVHKIRQPGRVMSWGDAGGPPTVNRRWNLLRSPEA
jgi:hypothetical protein